MSLPVHLVEHLDATGVGALVEVDGDEAHHAVAVRRLRVGEQVALTDGRGHWVTGSVETTGKRHFAVRVATAQQVPEPEPALRVVQALPKGERGELAVEVLTEIGVATIVPWAAARSVAVWKGERAVKSLARWRSTAREAAKQSRRAWHPQVSELADLDAVVACVRAADLALVLHEEAEHALADLDVPVDGQVLLVVGPEGGISPEELTALVGAGALGVRLGPEVLRTSTAGLAAAAALLARTARWGTTRGRHPAG